MTDVRAEDGDGGLGEFERILHSLSRGTPQSLRVQAFIALQDALNVVDCEEIISRICDDSRLLCRCIQRDTVLSAKTFSILGYHQSKLLDEDQNQGMAQKNSQHQGSSAYNRSVLMARNNLNCGQLSSDRTVSGPGSDGERSRIVKNDDERANNNALRMNSPSQRPSSAQLHCTNLIECHHINGQLGAVLYPL